MKHKIKIIGLPIIVFFLFSCFKTNETGKTDLESAKKNNETLTKSIEIKVDTIKSSIDEEVNDHDEFISSELFAKWKGKYILKQEEVLDGYGRVSTLVSELNLIKPDSCVFKSWLADENGVRYKEDDNYQEYIGVIYATTNKDSIEFYTKQVVSGGNDNLSPLLTLSKKKKEYSIHSLLTSPPHNGIVEMKIVKKE